MNISLDVIYKALNNINKKYVIKGLDDVIQKLKEPLMIMIMGTYSSGKSTFINAFVEKQIAAVDATEATAVITKLCYGLSDRVLLYYRDGSVVERNVDDFEKLTCVANDGNRNELRILRSKCKYIERQMPLDSLKDIVIIDSPGLNGNEEKLTDITEEFSKNADVVLWMLDANQAVSQIEKTALESLPSRLKPVAVVNKIDLINEDDDLDDFLDEIRIKLDDIVLKVIGVSAKYAIKGRTENKEIYYQESRFYEIYNLLDEEIVKNKDYLKWNSFMDGLSDVIDKNPNIKTNTYFSEFIENVLNEVLLNEIKIDNAQAWNLLGKLTEFGISHYGYDAFYCYKKAAERKHIRALEYMVDFYNKPDSNKYDRLYWCTRGAAIGLESAEKILADIHDSDKNYKDAFELYKKVAAKNDKEAEFKLGYYYLHGLGTDSNIALAYEWLLKSYNKGNAQAAYWLGFLFDENKNYKDFDKALECYKYAAVNGISDAYERFAFYLEVAGDYQGGVLWYEKAVANETNIEKRGRIACRLGLLYSGNYNGIEKNIDEEYEYYILATKLGNVFGKYKLASLYMNNGQLLNSAEKLPNYSKGISLLKECIIAGVSEAKVQMGLAYLRGNGVSKDVVTAFSFFEEADANNVLDGKYWLGYCYKNGIGVSQNYSKALQLFDIVHSKDHERIDAQAMLAEFYFYGYCCVVDYQKAFAFATKPAAKGNSVSLYIVGYIFETGCLGDQNYKAALDYYIKAYANGFINCRDNIMHCYYNLALDALSKENYSLAKNYLEASQSVYKNKDEKCYKLYDRLSRGIIYAEKFFEYFCSGNLEKCQFFYVNVNTYADNFVKMKFYYKLGFVYFSGNYCHQNKYRALEYFKKASELGDVNSKFILSAYDCITRGGIATAKLYLEKASLYNEPICMAWFAEYKFSLNYSDINQLKTIRNEAYELYVKSYEAGYSGAGLGIAKAIFENKLIVKNNEEDNYREGCRWLEEVDKKYYNGDVKYLLAVQMRKIYFASTDRALILLKESASTGNVKATQVLEKYAITGDLAGAIESVEDVVVNSVKTSVNFLKGLFRR